jgi:transcriptional regulator with XRE-family HTH domain
MPSSFPELAELGRRVRDRRRELGLSQEKVAERAGFDRTYISKIERGRQNLASHNVILLAQALNLDPGDLMRGLRAD